MKILNKNTNGTRNRALSELEVMQELTPGDKNYGKIAVGTDGTYEGEILVGKDSDVQNALANIDATNPFNGYAGAKKDMRFETSASNILSVANMQEQYIVDGKVIKPTETINLNTTNDRTGFNGEGDNSFVPNVKVVGFDPISTGSITGNHVAVDTQIGTILDNIPAQTANTRIKCRVKPTTDGIKVEILNKSDSDAVVRTQTVDSTDAETLTFTLPVNDDGYKVKATKITNAGVDDGDADTDDASEDIQVTSEVSTGLVVDGKVKRGDYCVVDKEELVTNGRFDVDTNGWSDTINGTKVQSSETLEWTVTDDGVNRLQYQNMPALQGAKYIFGGSIQVLEANSTKRAVCSLYSSSDGSTRGPLVCEYTTLLTDTWESFTLAGTSTDNYLLVEVIVIDPNVADGKAGDKLYIDNISVQLADDTFKAIEDTDDGESLGSSKFKPADYISNQVFVGMKNDGTYIYDVLMNDAYAKESTTETLSNNGYASLGRGLFSKGSDVITPIGRWQTLNKGCGHPMLNNYGCAMWRSSRNYGWAFYWHVSNANNDMPKESISDCFNDAATTNRSYNGAVSGSLNSAHPQSKFYDIIYPSQWLDMRYSSTKTNLPELASKVFSDGVSGKGGVCDTDVATPVTSSKTRLTIDTLTDSTQTVWSLSDKAITIHQVLKSTDSGVTWASTSFTHQAVDNTVTTEASDEIMVSYTASIPVATIQDPKAVDYVLEKYIASNSHSIYQANNITGLIGVGTGDDMESGYLGDCDVGVADWQLTQENQLTSMNGLVSIGDTIFVKDASLTTRSDSYVPRDSTYWEVIGNPVDTFGGFPFGHGTYSKEIGFAQPKHQTIALSSAGDKASKAFLTIASDSDGELYAQWMVEEIKTDGDTGDFSQLVNGVKDDFNGQTVRTVCASTPLNLLKEDK